MASPLVRHVSDSIHNASLVSLADLKNQYSHHQASCLTIQRFDRGCGFVHARDVRLCGLIEPRDRDVVLTKFWQIGSFHSSENTFCISLPYLINYRRPNTPSNRPCHFFQFLLRGPDDDDVRVP